MTTNQELVMDWRHVWTLLVIHGGPPDSLAAKLVAELAERDVEANAFSVEDVDLAGPLDPAEQSLAYAERRLDHLERRLAAVTAERNQLVTDVVDQMARTLKAKRELERFLPAAREWGTALGQAMKRATSAEADARKAQADADRAVTAAHHDLKHAREAQVEANAAADYWRTQRDQAVLDRDSLQRQLDHALNQLDVAQAERDEQPPMAAELASAKAQLEWMETALESTRAEHERRMATMTARVECIRAILHVVRGRVAEAPDVVGVRATAAQAERSET